ncbi:MAG: hypothetical protein JJ899_16505 [Alphaproteobacteria bacterium]|nr:hypothetical protein [Alphaproteobacteria bacterium]
MAQNRTYDRSLEDVGNIVHLEHVNVRVPDQLLATSFYVSALGLTRDPYMMTGIDNMWVNVGRSQFHLPTHGTDVLRGRTGLVLPWYDGLAERLEAARPLLADTAYDFKVRKSHIDVTCPWGNRIRCHPPAQRFGDMRVGMPYVLLDVPTGSAAGIAAFYREIMGAHAVADQFENAPAAVVRTGTNQHMYFRETRRSLPPFDGHHIQIYIADFAGPHERLRARGLVTEESDAHQYRFEDIVDPESGEPLFTLEHEVRSLHHPLYGRPLVNRNPDQWIMNYTRGADALASA